MGEPLDPATKQRRHLLAKPIDSTFLPFSPAMRRALQGAGIFSVCQMVEKTVGELAGLLDVEDLVLAEELLAEYGLALGDTSNPDVIIMRQTMAATEND